MLKLTRDKKLNEAGDEDARGRYHGLEPVPFQQGNGRTGSASLSEVPPWSPAWPSQHRG